MIRRKLTRLELQLDDTKELDELSLKPASLIANQTTGAGFNFNFCSVNKHFHQHHQQQQQNIDRTLNDAEATSINNTSAANTSAAPASSTEAQERISYNPQPHSANNRFQAFNQSSQQLR